jgi:hypothetical protein
LDIGADTKGWGWQATILARPARIEYAGAVYHVLNRGSCRQDTFAVAGTFYRFSAASGVHRMAFKIIWEMPFF